MICLFYGTALPLIMEEWNLTPVEVGTMGSYGLFGMMFGAIIFGILADRIGRKKVILINVLLFSAFTLFCAFADNATTFSIFRFLCWIRSWWNYAKYCCSSVMIMLLEQ